MKKNTLRIVSISIVIVVSLLLLWQFASSSTQHIATVDYSNSYSTVATIYQRKTFFANGYFWLFYGNGTSLFYTSSTDGLAWRNPTLMSHDISSSAISVWYENSNVHYVNAGGAGMPVLYRKGTISGNDIVWGEQQVIAQSAPEYEHYNAYCTVDSFGTPWVSFIRCNNNNPQNAWTAQIIRFNPSNNGLWESPTQISNDSPYPLRPCIIPLPNGNMYAVYASNNGIEGRLWDGTKWKQTETITARKPTSDFAFSAVELNDEMHVAMLEKDTNNVYHFKRTASGEWSEEQIASSAEIVSPPVLSVDNERGSFYCLWLQGKSLQVRKMANGSWHGFPINYLNLKSPRGLSTFYNFDEGKLGVAILDQLATTTETYRLDYLVVEDR